MGGNLNAGSNSAFHPSLNKVEYYMSYQSNEYKRSLFIKALRRNLWDIEYDEVEEVPCASWDNYHIKLYEKTFVVYKQEGDTLIPLKEYPYGRRQSQLLKRLMVHFK